MNILVVDDEVAMVETIRRGLKSRGYRVFGALDAHQALDQLYSGSDKIDLLVTDYWMPAMNGIDLLQAIRKTHPTLPVMIITAHARTSLVIEAIKNSFDSFIEKPFTLDQLVAEIERIKLNFPQTDRHPGKGPGIVVTEDAGKKRGAVKGHNCNKGDNPCSAT